MTQKDKVKELVGRSLNSYHTKSLQQIDRIEKENKKQNHMINVLTGELDNDYLSKTEEGSIVSLEHSKEGMVYIDGLEGNTLVNYCIDGSTEMILNGDIDLEGTFVTTTEGVDGGKVDVLCEGNTLVNLIQNPKIDIRDNWVIYGEPTIQNGVVSFSSTQSLVRYVHQVVKIKNDTTYTAIAKIKNQHNFIDFPKASLGIDLESIDGDIRIYSSDFVKNDNKDYIYVMCKITTKKHNSINYRISARGLVGEVQCKEFILLEGDWTNKEIPPYFEGMKSVGENTLKINPNSMPQGYGDNYIYGKSTTNNDTWICFKNGINLPKIAQTNNLIMALSSVEYQTSIDNGATWKRYTDAIMIDIKDIKQSTVDIYTDNTYSVIKRDKDIISDGHKIEISSKNYIGEIIEETGESKSGSLVTYEGTTDSDLIEVTEIFGKTVQDSTDLSKIESLGTLYTDESGTPILDANGKEQYKIDILSGNKNLWRDEFFDKWYDAPRVDNYYLEGFKPNTTYTVSTEKITIPPRVYYRFGIGGTYLVTLDNRGNDKEVVRHNVTSIATTDEKGRIKLGDYFNNKNNVMIFKNSVVDMQLEEGNTLTQFEESNQHKTTILLPTQLQKVGNIADRLYWDSVKGKYVVEKNIYESTLKNDISNLTLNHSYQHSAGVFGFEFALPKSNYRDWSNEYITNIHTVEGHITSVTDNAFTLFKTTRQRMVVNKILCEDTVGGFMDFITRNNAKLIFASDNTELIETNITEKIKVPTFANKTHIFCGGVGATNVDTTHLIINHPNPKRNKKEISLSEPLRGLPNGVKDRFVKIGGKWYIERSVMEYEITGKENWTTKVLSTPTSGVIGFEWVMNIDGVNKELICNKLPTEKNYADQLYKSIRTYEANSGIVIVLNTTDLTTQDVNGFITWLETNNLIFTKQLAIPTYEPITDPTLLTYLDTTHISNNSLIPCNMKIKNSGYNTIIKPNTLYTVALETNKSGTIGINLGGAKTTTTNNVATITTPATLVDDSLRVSGKGIKGSKVRLLEGDKTNWIPSHFEGMKSCFEDKVNSDGLYEMEILSNNKNLFNGTWVYDERNNKINSRDLIKVKPNTTYTISDNLNYRYQIYEYSDKSTHFNAMYPYAGSYTFTTNKRTHYLRFSTYAPSTDVDVKFILEEGRNITLYEPNKSNKIQFSPIEPLRKWDRFVSIDGKLMIERGSKQVNLGVDWNDKQKLSTNIYRYTLNDVQGAYQMAVTICNNNTITKVSLNDDEDKILKYFNDGIWYQTYDDFTLEDLKEYFISNNTQLIFKLKEPTYEEIPHGLQKIILEGYENGTIFIDTIMPPTVSVRYSGETPMTSKLKKTDTYVGMNTYDINENIIPYLLDMDYRVVMLQLASGQTIAQYKSLGNIYLMLQRDIQSQRYTKDEYRNRINNYFQVGKITEEEYNKLGEMLND